MSIWRIEPSFAALMSVSKQRRTIARAAHAVPLLERRSFLLFLNAHIPSQNGAT
ncbi:hypothetical protein [Clostridium merdae]|uniref:hypothetical protein n=1 Tax=Clostridium merdae TaxID=1958780 RepID=UPI0013562925|nr:hypothetical protein [Clostridium merdae]